MALMFGRFDIQSELSRSGTALIYKAMDTKTDQMVALKTQSLGPLGDRADQFVDTLIDEGESVRELANQNIVVLYGAGEIDGQFCAAMEYIQGNSIATMLARREGFSIWDLLDITRQVGAGLEHAASKGVTHCSLEPAKIMVQWDGMVKILGYGISNMSLIGAESSQGLGRLMPYCSPEQIRGEVIDLRSNIFTLGTILYEMVAGRKAFDAVEPVALVGQIENGMPPSPATVNGKIHPGVSALIIKALAKDPAERYQSARELVDELEKCKDNSAKAAPAIPNAAPPPNTAAGRAARAAAASKFVSAAPSEAVKPSVRSGPPVSSKPIALKASSSVESRTAAAGAGGSGSPRLSKIYSAIQSVENSQATHQESSATANSNSGARLISDFEMAGLESSAARGPALSAAGVGQAADRPSLRVPVDPLMSRSVMPKSPMSESLMSGPVMSEPVISDVLMTDPLMSGNGAGASGKSFSDLAEMPPLREAAFTPPSFAEDAEPAHSVVQVYPKKKEEKPRLQPREVAGRAIKEISSIPPRLLLFSILGAVGLILVVAIAVFFHVRSEDDGATAAPQPTKAASPSSGQPVVQASTARIEKPVPLPEETETRLTVHPVEKRGSNKRLAPAPATVATVAPGDALIDSSPQGAQFQVDGKNDPSWVTPFTLTGLSPGKHIISASKSGYSSEIRSVDVAAGGRASLLLHLSAMNALVVVNSTPPGASVVIDGRPTGRVTPAQFAVEKGSHSVLLRKDGYLDETVTADLGPAQNFQYAPLLKTLGNTEDMRTVGKFNGLFGRGADNAAGKGSIMIRTLPKGAQVAINQRVLDKASPVGVVVGAGNYVVDITLTGFKPIHKVVTVDRGDRTAINETLEPQ